MVYDPTAITPSFSYDPNTGLRGKYDLGTGVEIGELDKGIARGMQNLGSGFEATLGQFAEPLAPEFARRRIDNAVRQTQAAYRSYAPDIQTYHDVHSLSDAAKYAAGTLGEQVPLIGSLLVGGLTGRALTAAGAKKLGTLAGGATGVFPQETGEAVMGLHEDPDAMANTTPLSRLGISVGKGTVNSLLEALPETTLLNKTLARSEPLRDGLLNAGARVARRGLEQNAGEAATEYLQELTGQAAQSYASEKDRFNADKRIEAAIRGGIGGHVFGTVAGSGEVLAHKLLGPKGDVDFTDDIPPEIRAQGVDAAINYLDQKDKSREAHVTSMLDKELESPTLTPERADLINRLKSDVSNPDTQRRAMKVVQSRKNGEALGGMVGAVVRHLTYQKKPQDSESLSGEALSNWIDTAKQLGYLFDSTDTPWKDSDLQVLARSAADSTTRTNDEQTKLTNLFSEMRALNPEHQQAIEAFAQQHKIPLRMGAYDTIKKVFGATTNGRDVPMSAEYMNMVADHALKALSHATHVPVTPGDKHLDALVKQLQSGKGDRKELIDEIQAHVEAKQKTLQEDRGGNQLKQYRKEFTDPNTSEERRKQLIPMIRQLANTSQAKQVSPQFAAQRQHLTSLLGEKGYDTLLSAMSKHFTQYGNTHIVHNPVEDVNDETDVEHQPAAASTGVNALDIVKAKLFAEEELAKFAPEMTGKLKQLMTNIRVRREVAKQVQAANRMLAADLQSQVIQGDDVTTNAEFDPHAFMAMVRDTIEAKKQEYIAAGETPPTSLDMSAGDVKTLTAAVGAITRGEVTAKLIDNPADTTSIFGPYFEYDAKDNLGNNINGPVLTTERRLSTPQGTKAEVEFEGEEAAKKVMDKHELPFSVLHDAAVRAFIAKSINDTDTEDVFQPEDLPLLSLDDDQKIKNGRTSLYTVRMVDADGNVHHLNAHAITSAMAAINMGKGESNDSGLSYRAKMARQFMSGYAAVVESLGLQPVQADTTVAPQKVDGGNKFFYMTPEGEKRFVTITPEQHAAYAATGKVQYTDQLSGNTYDLIQQSRKVNFPQFDGGLIPDRGLTQEEWDAYAKDGTLPAGVGLTIHPKTILKSTGGRDLPIYSEELAKYAGSKFFTKTESLAEESEQDKRKDLVQMLEKNQNDLEHYIDAIELRMAELAEDADNGDMDAEEELERLEGLYVKAQADGMLYAEKEEGNTDHMFPDSFFEDPKVWMSGELNPNFNYGRIKLTKRAKVNYGIGKKTAIAGLDKGVVGKDGVLVSKATGFDGATEGPDMLGKRLERAIREVSGLHSGTKNIGADKHVFAKYGYVAYVLRGALVDIQGALNSLQDASKNFRVAQDRIEKAKTLITQQGKDAFYIRTKYRNNEYSDESTVQESVAVQKNSYALANRLTQLASDIRNAEGLGGVEVLKKYMNESAPKDSDVGSDNLISGLKYDIDQLKNVAWPATVAMPALQRGIEQKKIRAEIVKLEDQLSALLPTEKKKSTKAGNRKKLMSDVAFGEWLAKAPTLAQVREYVNAVGDALPTLQREELEARKDYKAVFAPEVKEPEAAPVPAAPETAPAPVASGITPAIEATLLKYPRISKLKVALKEGTGLTDEDRKAIRAKLNEMSVARGSAVEDVEKQVAPMLERWKEQYNLPNLRITFEERPEYERLGSRVMGTHHNGEIWINPDHITKGNASLTSTLSTVAHEVGHAVKDKYFKDNMPGSVHDKLYKAWQEDRAKVEARGALPVSQFAHDWGSLSIQQRAAKETKTTTAHVEGVNKKRGEDYVLSFDEYVAEQFSRFALGELENEKQVAPAGMEDVYAFFRKVLGEIRKLFENAKAEGVLPINYDVRAEMKDWVREAREQAAANNAESVAKAKEWIKTATLKGVQSAMKDNKVAGANMTSELKMLLKIRETELKQLQKQAPKPTGPTIAEDINNSPDSWKGARDTLGRDPDIEEVNESFSLKLANLTNPIIIQKLITAREQKLETLAAKGKTQNREKLKATIQLEIEAAKKRLAELQAAPVAPVAPTAPKSTKPATTKTAPKTQKPAPVPELPGDDITEHLPDPQTPEAVVATQAARSNPEAPEAEAYLRKILGKNVQVVLGDFPEFAGSYRWDKQHKTHIIKLSRLAGLAGEVEQKNELTSLFMAGTQQETLSHEAFHGMARKMKGTEAYRALAKFALQPNVMAQLKVLLKDHPEALAEARGSLGERLAYAYMFYVSGKLTIKDPEAVGWYNKLREFIRSIMGVLTANEKAVAIFSAMNEGRMANLKKKQAKNLHKTLKLQSVMEKFYEAHPTLEQMKDGLYKVFTGQKKRAESSGSLEGQKIHSLLWLEPGENSELSDHPDDLLHARTQVSNQYMHWFASLVKDWNRADLREVMLRIRQNAPSQSARETELREGIKGMFADLFQYMSDNGVMRGVIDEETGEKTWEPLQAMADYRMPQAWDSSAIAGDVPGFIEFLGRAGVEPATAAAVAESITRSPLGVDEVKQSLYQVKLTPAMTSLNERQIQIPDNMQEEATNWMRQDMVEVMAVYIRQAVHRAEFTKRFGNDGEVIQQALDAMKREGVATEDEINEVRLAVKAAEGTIGKDIDPKWREFNSTMITYQNWRVLGMSLFTSLIDPLGIAVKTGNMADAWEAFKIGMTSLTGGLDQDEAYELSGLLGVIDQSMQLESIGNMYSGQYMTGWQKHANDLLFKINGMDAWNNGMRLAAMKIGLRWIVANQNKPEVLAELGIDASKIDWDIESEDFVYQEEVTRGIFRFVDETILRPNALQRPAWGSDPHWALVWHLKQFTFTFSQVIIAGAVKQAEKGNMMPLYILASYVPFMMAADFLRGLVQGGGEEPEWKKKETLGQRVGDGIMRSGVLGPYAFAEEAYMDSNRGLITGTSFLGPTVNQVVDVAGKVGDLGGGDDTTKDKFTTTEKVAGIVEDMLPLNNVYGDWDMFSAAPDADERGKK